MKIKYPVFTVELVMDEHYNLLNVHQNKDSELEIDNKELLDAFLKMKLNTPNHKKTKSNGEVFTPETLINEMLDKLPKDVWTNSELKWFDPAVGTGQFMVIVYRRLMKGLQNDIPDEAERKNHIIKNMLFMSELDEQNYTECEKIFGNDCNIFKGNTLESSNDEFKFAQQFGISKFDVIVGNPPYNKPFHSNAKNAMPLYTEFISRLIEKSRFLLFIIPSKWMFGGKGVETFRNFMFKRKDLSMMKIFDDASTVFGKTIDLKGGVCYFLKDSTYYGNININGKVTDLSKHSVFVHDEFNLLVAKITEQSKMLDELFVSKNAFGIKTNDYRLKTEACKNCYKVYVSKKNGFVKYINKKDIKLKKELLRWKVATTAAAFKEKSGFGNIFTASQNELISESYVGFMVNTEEEAKSLESYLKTKLPNLMLSLRKSKQDVTTDTVKWIPLVPFDRQWTNEKVYEYFEFTPQLISLIETTRVNGLIS